MANQAEILSTLSDEQLLALKQGNFSAIDNDTLLRLSGREPKPTFLDKAVDVSEKITGGLGKAVNVATTPVRKVGELSKGLSERITEKATELGAPAPLAAFAGIQAAGPEVVIEGIKIPFKLLDAASNIAHKGAGAVSEFLARHGMNPAAAATLGTLISMSPDIALSLAGSPTALKLGVRGARAAKTGSKFLKSKLPKKKPQIKILQPEEIETQGIIRRRKVASGLEKRLKEPQRELSELEASKQKLPGVEKAQKTEALAEQRKLSEEFGQMRKQALEPAEQKISKLQIKKKAAETDLVKRIRDFEEGKRLTGRKINKIESEVAKLSPRDVIKLEKQVRKGPIKALEFAEKPRIARIINQSPEQLAKKIKPQSIQRLRKLFETVKEEGMSGAARDALRGLKDKFANAMRHISKEDDIALTKFNKIDKELRSLKEKKGVASKEITAKIQQAKSELDELKRSIETPKEITKAGERIKQLDVDAANRKAFVEGEISKVKKVIAGHKKDAAQAFKKIEEGKAFKRNRLAKATDKGAGKFIRRLITNAVMRALLVKGIR